MFCKIVAGEISSEKVVESGGFVVRRVAKQEVEGYLLVISTKHYESFLDLPSDLYLKLLVTVKKVVEKLGMKDFNLVLNNGEVAGQIVPHFHLHILPRKGGDGPVRGNHLTLA